MRRFENSPMAVPRQYPSQASTGPFGIGTRNHFSKTRNVTRGMLRLIRITSLQAWRTTQRLERKTPRPPPRPQSNPEPPSFPHDRGAARQQDERGQDIGALHETVGV